MLFRLRLLVMRCMLLLLHLQQEHRLQAFVVAAERHILGQTHLHVPVFGDAQQNVAGLAILADGQQLVSPFRGGAGAGKLDPGQRLLKAAHAQEAVRGLGFAQQGKKLSVTYTLPVSNRSS